MRQGYEFSDVMVVPIPSFVNSRTEVDISVKLSDDLKLEFPVIASPMRGIVDAQFIGKLSQLGGIGILHRFYETEEKRFEEIALAKSYGKFGIAIGMNDYTKLNKFLEYEPDIILLDVANGYTINICEMCDNIASFIENKRCRTMLMSGNVVTKLGVEHLRDSGVKLVRCGIGSGGLCSTRSTTSVGIPQITALLDCCDVDGIKIVADGGIQSSGDGVKAFIAGADVLMAGSLFGQTFESPSDGIIYGMASRKLMEDVGYTQIKSVEGIEKAIDKKMSLAQFVDEFGWGMRSAGTYLNARTIEEMRTNGEFVLVGTGSIKNL